MSAELLQKLRDELRRQADPKTAAGAQAFFKEPITVYGVKSAAVGRLAAQYYQQIKKHSKREVFALCEELLRSDYSEEAFIACDWAYRRRAEYAPEDIEVFEGWLEKYINNWAKCDTLCNHTIGAFVDKFPQYTDRLKGWAGSANRWRRRAAAVTLIIPARRGRFLPEALEIAGRLLRDGDDLVQKGYGWLLKEASRQHQAEVFDFIMRHNDEMPRTALRYAIEKMPEEMRRRAMGREKGQGIG